MATTIEDWDPHGCVFCKYHFFNNVAIPTAVISTELEYHMLLTVSEKAIVRPIELRIRRICEEPRSDRGSTSRNWEIRLITSWPDSGTLSRQLLAAAIQRFRHALLERLLPTLLYKQKSSMFLACKLLTVYSSVSFISIIPIIGCYICLTKQAIKHFSLLLAIANAHIDLIYSGYERSKTSHDPAPYYRRCFKFKLEIHNYTLSVILLLLLKNIL